MKTSSVFTRSRMGLDNNVWLSMLVLIVICSGLLAYRIADNKKIKPCTSVTIIINGSPVSKAMIYYSDERLFFKANAPMEADDITWNFGDNTPKEHGYTTSHIFHTTGTFPITIVNGNCPTTETITIIKPVQTLLDSSGKIIEDITGNDKTQVGINEVYSTQLPANSYDWSIMNNSNYQPVQGKIANFKFKSKGSYTILLVLNHDRNKSYTKEVIVLPEKLSDMGEITSGLPIKPLRLAPVISFIVPSSGGPGTNVTINGSFFTGTNFVSLGGIPAKIISVSSTQIIAEIGEGASGPVVVTTEYGSETFSTPPFTYIPPKSAALPAPTRTEEVKAPPKQEQVEAEEPPIIVISDVQLKNMLENVVRNKFQAEDFKRFLCGGVSTKVRVNNEKNFITLGSLCERLRGKKIDIESAEKVPDQDNNDCETHLIVKYKEHKGIWPFNK